MINEELLSKLDRIEDLPVSEEMLGAYMEGNLDFFEEANISSIIQTDAYLSHLIYDARSLPADCPLATVPTLQEFDLPINNPAFESLSDSENISWGEETENLVACIETSMWEDSEEPSSELDEFNNPERFSIVDRNDPSEDSIDLDSSINDDLEDIDNLNF